MSLISYTHDQDSVLLRVKILDSSVTTGAGKTGLAFNTAGLIIGTICDNEATTTAYTTTGSTIETVTTLGTYAAPTATKCRFKEVDATNHKGIYEVQLADARYAITSAKSLLISIAGAANGAECDALVPLTQFDPYDPIGGGLSAMTAPTRIYTNPANPNRVIITRGAAYDGTSHAKLTWAAGKTVTGETIRFTIRDAGSDASIHTHTWVEAAGTQINLALTTTQTALMTTGKHKFDVRIEWSATSYEYVAGTEANSWIEILEDQSR